MKVKLYILWSEFFTELPFYVIKFILKVSSI